MIRPGQLIAAITLAAFGLCFAGLVFLGWPHDLGPVTTD